MLVFVFPSDGAQLCKQKKKTKSVVVIVFHCMFGGVALKGAVIETRFNLNYTAL